MSSRMPICRLRIAPGAAALPRLMREALKQVEVMTIRVRRSPRFATGYRGGLRGVDYAELRDADSLAPLSARSSAPARLLVARRIGRTRLIDTWLSAVTGHRFYTYKRRFRR